MKLRGLAEADVQVKYRKFTSYAYRVRKTTSIVTFTLHHAYSTIICTICHFLRDSLRRVNNCVKPRIAICTPIAACWFICGCQSSNVPQIQQIRGNFAFAFGRYNVTIRAVLMKFILAINVGLSCNIQS